MKTLGPLILGFIAGAFGFSELYVTNESYRGIVEFLRDNAIILASMAFILGGINLVQVNWPKIRRREPDWQYKVVLLGAAAVMFLVSFPRWHLHTGPATPGYLSFDAVPAQTTGPATLRIDAAHEYALVIVDGGKALRAWHDGDPTDLAAEPGSQPLELELEPGPHTVVVALDPLVKGYQEYAPNVWVIDGPEQLAAYWADARTKIGGTEIPDVRGVPMAVPAGATVTANAHLELLWGGKSEDSGRVHNWLYYYVFFPCNATMFALLAFFIASAAFRAFRARSPEAALLLGAAILVMIGLVPIGGAVWEEFPAIGDWIMDVLNTTGRRAIMMGAALGAVATGLRVVLGIERSHLGAE